MDALEASARGSRRCAAFRELALFAAKQGPEPTRVPTLWPVARR